MEPAGSRCAECGTYCAARLLICPSCQALVHRARLEALRAEADASAAAGDLRAAREAYRRAMPLLPQGSVQHAAVARRVGELTERIGAAPVASGARPEGMPRWMGALGGFGLLLWKGKFLLLLVVSKLKLLLLGLGKASTALSMLASVGVYWAVFGLPFALGLVLSIYVHEMGHVLALQHYGIGASAPMFVPGFGAYVRLEQRPATSVEDARTGMAGPLAGLGAALACLALHAATHAPIFAAIAKLGAWINLFNLVPVWQLDGSRAFASLGRLQRGVLALAMVGCYLVTREGLLLLLALAAGFRAVAGGASEEDDWPGVGLFVVVLIALTAIAALEVPGLSAAR